MAEAGIRAAYNLGTIGMRMGFLLLRASRSAQLCVRKRVKDGPNPAEAERQVQAVRGSERS